MLGLKLIHVSKRGPWCQSSWWPLSHMIVGPHKQLFTPDRKVFSQMMIPWASLLTILQKPAMPHSRRFDRCQPLERVVAMNQCHLAQQGAPVFFFFWNSPLITPVQLDPTGGVVGINCLFVCCQVTIPPTPVSGSCYLPLGALQLMWATCCKIQWQSWYICW